MKKRPHPPELAVTAPEGKKTRTAQGRKRPKPDSDPDPPIPPNPPQKQLPGMSDAPSNQVTTQTAPHPSVIAIAPTGKPGHIKPAGNPRPRRWAGPRRPIDDDIVIPVPRGKPDRPVFPTTPQTRRQPHPVHRQGHTKTALTVEALPHSRGQTP